MKQQLRAAVLVVVAALTVGVTTALAVPGLSRTIAALGGPDSAGASSWSTGSNPAVNSQRLRITNLGRHCCRWRGQAEQAHSFARDGFSVSQLAAQVRQALAVHARFVTLDLGTADLCSTMAPASFHAHFAAGVSAFRRDPVARHDGPRTMLVLSIENLVAHWQTLRADPAGAAWLRAGHSLPCGLGYAVSATWLIAIATRTTALNRILDRDCYQLGCLYDAGAHYRMPLRTTDFRPGNYARLSVTGERKLAATEWRPTLVALARIA